MSEMYMNVDVVCLNGPFRFECRKFGFTIIVIIFVNVVHLSTATVEFIHYIDFPLATQNQFHTVLLQECIFEVEALSQ